MSTSLIPDSILYPTESRQELEALTNQLRLEFQPSNEAEEEVFENIVIASWLRKRYEKVRSKLYDRKHTLTADSPNLPVTIDSIKRFQYEVEQQKKQLAGLRKALRRIREDKTVSMKEELHEYLPAA